MRTIPTGSGFKLQSNHGMHGNFEVLVPNEEVNSGLTHVYRDNNLPNPQWASYDFTGDVIFLNNTIGKVDAVSLMQTNSITPVHWKP